MNTQIRTAVVTGASKDICGAVAKWLAADGSGADLQMQFLWGSRKR